MLNFLKELFNPSLRCKRLGHKIKTIRKRIRIKPKESYSRFVAEDYYAKLDICSRCGEEHKPYDNEYITSWNSCSMPLSMWNDIREKGYVIIYE